MFVQNVKVLTGIYQVHKMPKTTITVDAWQCSRCQYKWKGKTEEKPLRCPDCGSCYWDIPRKNEEVKEDGTTPNTKRNPV